MRCHLCIHASQLTGRITFVQELKMDGCTFSSMTLKKETFIGLEAGLVWRSSLPRSCASPHTNSVKPTWNSLFVQRARISCIWIYRNRFMENLRSQLILWALYKMRKQWFKKRFIMILWAVGSIREASLTWTSQRRDLSLSLSLKMTRLSGFGISPLDCVSCPGVTT